MAYQFPLDAVLRIRGIVEEQEERMLQKIQFEITQALEGLERTNARIAGSDASRRADVFKAFVGHNIHASYEEMQALKQTRKELEEKLQKLEQLRERQMVVYRGARRNREMLTNICAEKRDAYELDMARREQRILDDNHMARRERG